MIDRLIEGLEKLRALLSKEEVRGVELICFGSRPHTAKAILHSNARLHEPKADGYRFQIV
jgi:hypothetical protein